MSQSSTSNPAEILLALLERVPNADALEVLLEPEHLLTLLRNRGVPDEEIRRQLKGGANPGKLLLDLLTKEPDAQKLLAELGNPVPKKGSPQKASPSSFVSSSGRAGKPSPVTSLVLGLLLLVPSAWYLFIHLDVIHVPGLIRFFPGAYALGFSALFVGVVSTVRGAVGLLRK